MLCRAVTLQGTLVTDDGDVEEVVLKRVKARVQGASEMHEAEHLINVLASKAAGEAVAPFLGYSLVEQTVRQAGDGLTARQPGSRGLCCRQPRVGAQRDSVLCECLLDPARGFVVTSCCVRQHPSQLPPPAVWSPLQRPVAGVVL